MDVPLWTNMQQQFVILTLSRTNDHHYEALSGVHIKHSMGKCLRTPVGARRECLLSPWPAFSIFLTALYLMLWKNLKKK